MHTTMRLLLALVFIQALTSTVFGDGEEMGAAVMPKDSTSPVWKTSTAAERHKLRKNILDDDVYDKKIYPDNTTVAFGGHLLSFYLDDDETTFSTFEAQVWLRYKWTDSRLSWNPTEFSGLNVLHVPINEVWKPDITLYNSADPTEMMSCFDSEAIVYSTGDVLWVPPCKLQAHCPLSLDIAPYGEQTCYLKFGSWTLNDELLDIQFFDGKHEFETEELSDGLGWKIVSQNAERVSKEYSCCPGMKWPALQFNFTVQRVPEGPARHAH